MIFWSSLLWSSTAFSSFISLFHIKRATNMSEIPPLCSSIISQPGQYQRGGILPSLASRTGASTTKLDGEHQTSSPTPHDQSTSLKQQPAQTPSPPPSLSTPAPISLAASLADAIDHIEQKRRLTWGVVSRGRRVPAPHFRRAFVLTTFTCLLTHQEPLGHFLVNSRTALTAASPATTGWRRPAPAPHDGVRSPDSGRGLRPLAGVLAVLCFPAPSPAPVWDTAAAGCRCCWCDTAPNAAPPRCEGQTRMMDDGRS